LLPRQREGELFTRHHGRIPSTFDCSPTIFHYLRSPRPPVATIPQNKRANDKTAIEPFKENDPKISTMNKYSAPDTLLPSDSISFAAAPSLDLLPDVDKPVYKLSVIANTLLPSDNISFAAAPSLDLLPDVDKPVDKLSVIAIKRPSMSELAGLEDLARYCPGGYHPVNIGDIFAYGGYTLTVLHKLSHSAKFTIWLVQDSRNNRKLAFKILTADASHGEGSEFDVAEHLKKQKDTRRKTRSNKHPGEDFVMDVIAAFWINGPNGSHKCILSNVLGPRVSGVRSVSGRLSPAVVRKIIPQIAKGVSYLHSIGVVHGSKQTVLSCS
jgi:hypothetical protein